MKITFEEYDAYIEKLKDLKGHSYYPTIQEIDNILAKNPEKYLKFILYLLEYNDPPKNEKEAYAKLLLRNIVDDSLEFIDTI